MAFISSGSRKVSLSTHTLNPSLGPSHTRVLPLPPLGAGGDIPRAGLESGSEPESAGQETFSSQWHFPNTGG